MQGIVPVAKSLDHAGPITRCVDDAAIVFAALSGEPIQLQHDVSPRIGRLRGFFDSPMTSVIEAIDVTLPIDFDQAIQHHRTIMLAETVRAHGNLPAVSLKPGIRGLLDEGRTISDGSYRNSIDYQQQLRLRVEKEWPSVDALLMPATTGPPPDTSSTGDPRFNSPWSLLGLPAVSLPVSLDENGLPQALQLVGRAGCDQQLLSIAHRVETQLQHQCTRWQSQ
jgi:Asp-tRNA(Asn)/Glu-tRNA(Gln) amidotransferase A subunit family amidase